MGQRMTSLLALTACLWLSATVPGDHAQAQSAPDGIPAQVINTPEAVNAYVLPRESAPLMMLLNGGMRFTALARSQDDGWVQAYFTNGLYGWVQVENVETAYSYTILDLPQTQPDPDTILQFAPFWNFDSPRNLEIYQRGLQKGRRANAFAKVGDSITVAPMYLTPIGQNVYQLGEYAYLQQVLNHFGTTDENSFINKSSAAGVGWSTRDILNPIKAARAGCPQGMTPLMCEYYFTQAAFSLIMLGTNDTTVMEVPEFQDNLNTIIVQTIDEGIVPVLFTVPPLLLGTWDERPYNQAIIRVAQAHETPVINFWLAVQPLPNSGISEDLVHPSSPPSNAGTTLFTPDKLQYGYTVRNLITLQGLDLLLRETVYAGT